MNFNLLTDAWIPVRMSGDGRAETLGLLDLFRRSAQISDLSVSIHERISLMRLLVCITQAALDALDEADEWEGWGDDLEEKTTAYLGEWHAHFELFGEGPRFLQRNTDVKKPQPMAKMVFEMSTGHSSLLIDHFGEEDRNFTPAFLARTILSYQNHFVGGSMGQAHEFQGEKGIAGPAINCLHTFLIGRDLRSSILLNCIDRGTLGPLGRPEGYGRPVWEVGPSDTYLGRLAPLPCNLWIEGAKIRISPGYVYSLFTESHIREPSTTIITGKRNGAEAPVLLRASIGRGIWRDLHCLTVLSKEERKAPLSFLSHFTARHGPDVTFWSGELIKAKDAKILDALESRFTVPWQLFEESGRTRYQKGVQFAELYHSKLCAAVYVYGMQLSTEDRLKGEDSEDFANAVAKRMKNPKRKKSQVEQSIRHYWNTLDHKSATLLELLKGAGTENDPMGSSTFGEAADPWTLAVRKAAREAYDATCPRSTPRQLEAYAAGLKQFAPKTKKSKPATAQPQ